MSQSSSFSRPGAIDLSGLGQSSSAAGAPPAAGAGGGSGRAYDLDATEASFQADVIERSLQHPVVVELWSARSAASKDLGALLKRLASEYDGKFLLARVDVDTNPAVAQAFGAQAVPTVVGVLRGQPIPLFQGTVDEQTARQYVDQLVTVAVANGISGRAAPTGAGAEQPEDDGAAEAAADARYAAAETALAAGDVDGAVAAYETLLEQTPGDAIAKQGLAGAKLIGRTKDLPADLPGRADAAPDDVALQTQAADTEVLTGNVEGAFGRLIRTVQRTAGDDRETARKHLLELFEVIGSDDPRVAKARQQLMAALF